MAAKKTASKKSAGVKNAKKSTNILNSSKKQIRISVAFCIAVLTGAVVFIETGGIWGHLRNFFFGIFGWSVFILPFAILFICAVSAIGKDTKKFRYRVIETAVILLLVMSLVHIFRCTPDLSYADQIKEAYNSFKLYPETGFKYSSGVLGALLGALPLLISDGSRIAAAVINILLLFLFIMLFAGTTLIKIIHSLKKPAEAVSEYAEDKKEDLRESLETVSADVSDYRAKRAERAERRRIRKEDNNDIDIPLSDEKTKPDMGIDNFLNEKGSLNRKKSKTNADTVTVEKEKSEPVQDNIELLDSFENTPVTAAPPLEEILNRNTVQKVAVQTIDSEPENTKESETVSAEDVIYAQAEIEEEIIKAEVRKKEYEYPPLDCLNMPKQTVSGDDSEQLRERAEKIVSTLQSFGVGTHIVDICRSPSVTRFELQPDPGVKISRITSLADDIAMNLASSGVRIEAPIPNKNAVGIEVPNAERAMVTLREIIDLPEYRNAKSKLNVALGRDIQGNPTYCDIAKMPHLLVAGTTGSGKSVCLNTMIVSILYNASPDEVKLVLIDPKKVEFTMYQSLPHLLIPVVCDPRKAAGALSWAVAEMDKRYALFSEKGVRNIQGYNSMASGEGWTKMPQIVIVIDEFSDLMMAASNEVEELVCRLAQKARAAGMHLIIATQRPSVDVITGLIKANVPSRIALSVKSQIDSRTIIDIQGAEKLLGNGDMLYCPVGLSKPVRVQGAYLSDEEIENVIDYVKSQGEASYDDNVIREIEEKAARDDNKKKSAVVNTDADSDDGDEMIPKAIEVVVESGMASTTLLQRKLKLGYARAARIIDELSEKGIVGPYEGSKPRKVLITKDQWYEMQANSSSSAPQQMSVEDMPQYPQNESSGSEPETYADHNYFGGAVSGNSGDDDF